MDKNEISDAVRRLRQVLQDNSLGTTEYPPTWWAVAILISVSVITGVVLATIIILGVKGMLP